MMKGLRLPKVWIFWGHFNLKALSLVAELVTYAFLQMTSSPRCLKFWKVVDVNVAGDAYIELEAMKMIMALVLRGSSSCFSSDPLRRLHLS